MIHPNSSLDRVRVCETLIAVFDQALPACAQIEYRLVGTGAALLHGVQLPARDVDLLVKTRAAVDAFGAALAVFECLVSPTWLPEANQYYANYDVHGVEVGFSTVELETSSDVIETFGRGPWEHYAVIECATYPIPTVALELRLITELFRNRPDRFDPILRVLHEKGCDIDLVSRGLDFLGLPQSRRDEVLRQLKRI